MTWYLTVGDKTTRDQNASRYGGSKFGGIEPAHASGNLFIYSDPASGTEFGYDFDGWFEAEGVFRYTGDGQVGDQQLAGRNLTLLEHVDRGLKVRLFVADGIAPGSRNTKAQRYVGEFRIDPNDPYRVEDAKDRDGDERKLLVFRLLPVGSFEDVFAATVQEPTVDVPATELVALEQVLETEFAQTSDREDGTAERREATLVESFGNHLSAQGHDTARHRIRIAESSRPLFTDIFDLTNGTLYEAKSSASRNHIRLAIGQLLDYRRYIDPLPNHIAVLVPSEPAHDMLDLLHELGIGCTWQVGSAFDSA